MIYDADINPITSAALTIAPAADREFTLLIDCVDGYEITGVTANVDVGIFAKAETGDAWTDIVAGSVDISSYEPARKTFYFKIEVDALADPASEIIAINVARPA